MVAGLYYAVVHLALRNFVVRGHVWEHTKTILRRLENDPFVRFVARSFDITFHPTALQKPTDPSQPKLRGRQ